MAAIISDSVIADGLALHPHPAHSLRGRGSARPYRV